MTMMDGLGEVWILNEDGTETRADGAFMRWPAGYVPTPEELANALPKARPVPEESCDDEDDGSVCERVRVKLQPMNGPSGWEQCRANVRGALPLIEAIEQLLQVAPRLGDELWNDVDIVLRRSA